MKTKHGRSHRMHGPQAIGPLLSQQLVASFLAKLWYGRAVFLVHHGPTQDNAYRSSELNLYACNGCVSCFYGNHSNSAHVNWQRRFGGPMQCLQQNEIDAVGRACMNTVFMAHGELGSPSLATQHVLMFRVIQISLASSKSVALNLGTRYVYQLCLQKPKGATRPRSSRYIHSYEYDEEEDTKFRTHQYYKNNL